MAILHIVIDVDVDPTLVDPHEVAMDILDIATIASDIEVFSDSLATVVSAEWAGQPDVCDTCGRPVRWHAVGQCWVHVGGSSWCFPERSGYDQPKATLHGRTGREPWGE